MELYSAIDDELREVQQWLDRGVNDAKGRDYARRLMMIIRALLIELRAEKELRKNR